jgi:hypothetical protein
MKARDIVAGKWYRNACGILYQGLESYGGYGRYGVTTAGYKYWYDGDEEVPITPVTTLVDFAVGEKFKGGTVVHKDNGTVWCRNANGEDYLTSEERVVERLSFEDIKPGEHFSHEGKRYLRAKDLYAVSTDNWEVNYFSAKTEVEPCD